jgi:SMP-30/Gluconolactonase/LRE-like region
MVAKHSAGRRARWGPRTGGQRGHRPACRRRRSGGWRRVCARRRHRVPVHRCGGHAHRAGPIRGGSHRCAHERWRLRPARPFLAGAMAYDESPGAGALDRLELDGSCTRVLTGLTNSNGIGWSPDGATMYLADSGTGRVEAFDFDGGSGDISRRRTLVRIEQPGVAPDGLTVDEDGGIWVALWGGGAIQRYAADGSLLTTVRLPVERPTSCAFGGSDRATLFVTTARAGLDEIARAGQRDAWPFRRAGAAEVTAPTGPCPVRRTPVGRTASEHPRGERG